MANGNASEGEKKGWKQSHMNKEVLSKIYIENELDNIDVMDKIYDTNRDMLEKKHIADFTDMVDDQEIIENRLVSGFLFKKKKFRDLRIVTSLVEDIMKTQKRWYLMIAEKNINDPSD